MSRPEFDPDLIRELTKLLDETGLSEIEIGGGDNRVRVARILAPAVAIPSPPAPVAASVPAPASEPAPVIDTSHPGAVTSPMVGTVYTAPEPGSPAFIQAGDSVSEGQTLLIVEAMKTMNPIRAPRSGTVGRILVENGAPVEYGEVLLLLQ
jgi:acetyl-CoA carboxylase biotin carboxyl carrier protein